MAHGSKMISRVLEEADQAIGMARHFSPQVAAAWDAFRPPVEGNLAPDMSVYLESIAARLVTLRERLSQSHLHRSGLRARTLFQHGKVRAKAARLRYWLVEVRFLLDRTCGKGKGHADFEGRDDLQRIPIGQLERVSVNLLNLMRANPFGWGEKPFNIPVAWLCSNLEKAIAELQEEREALRSAQGVQDHAYNERFRSGAADERELRELIGVLRSLLKSSGHAEEAKELRRIRPSRQTTHASARPPCVKTKAERGPARVHSQEIKPQDPLGVRPRRETEPF